MSAVASESAVGFVVSLKREGDSVAIEVGASFGRRIWGRLLTLWPMRQEDGSLDRPRLEERAGVLGRDLMRCVTAEGLGTGLVAYVRTSTPGQMEMLPCTAESVASAIIECAVQGSA